MLQTHATDPCSHRFSNCVPAFCVLVSPRSLRKTEALWHFGTLCYQATVKRPGPGGILFLCVTKRDAQDRGPVALWHPLLPSDMERTWAWRHFVSLCHHKGCGRSRPCGTLAPFDTCRVGKALGAEAFRHQGSPADVHNTEALWHCGALCFLQSCASLRPCDVFGTHCDSLKCRGVGLEWIWDPLGPVGTPLGPV